MFEATCITLLLLQKYYNLSLNLDLNSTHSPTLIIHLILDFQT